MRARLDNLAIAQAVSSTGRVVCKASVRGSYSRPDPISRDRNYQILELRLRGAFCYLGGARPDRVVDVRSMAHQAAEQEGSAEPKDTILQVCTI